MTDTPNRSDASAAQNVQDTAARAAEAFGTLVETMARLRAPGGCPWDAEQTHASLIRYLVEESYEVVEAVETGGEPNMPLLREELGDVLLQVVFHSDIAAANPQGFDIVQVVEGLVQKLRSRHPDVFATESEGSSEAPRTAAEQQAAWDALKKKEKSDRGALDGVPPHLPALAMAEKTVSEAPRNLFSEGARGSAAPSVCLGSCWVAARMLRVLTPAFGLMLCFGRVPTLSQCGGVWVLFRFVARD